MQDKPRALVYYILLISILYAPVVFLGKSLQPALYQPHGLVDSWPHGYEGRVPVNTFDIDLATPAYYEWPINRLVGDLYGRGELPLWNPYQGGGVPLAAQYSTKAFFPYQVMENLSPVWTWDFFMLGRLLIAGFFTYLFLSLLGIEFAPAFLGGLLYMFSGSFTWFINLEQFTNSAMMLPAHIYCLERLALKKNWRETALAALSLGLVLLAGQPEMALYIIFLGCSYYFFSSIQGQPWKSLGRETLRYCSVAVLGFALAAPLLLPFIEYVDNAYHLHQPGGVMGVVEPTRLYKTLQILTPFEISFSPNDPAVNLAQTPGGEFFPFKIFADNGMWDFIGGYTGIICLLLSIAVFLPWIGKNSPALRNHVVFFVSFGALIILKNLGVKPFLWIGLLPFFDQAWSQRWAGPVWVFCLSAAGGISFQVLKNHLAPGAGQAHAVKRRGHSLALAAAFLIVLSVYSALLASNFLELWKAVAPALSGGALDLPGTLLKLNPYIGSSMFIGIGITLLMLISSVVVLAYYHRTGKGVCGIIPLAVFELWWAMPRGYDSDWNLFKLFMVVPALFLAAVFALDKRRLAVAGIALFAVGAVPLDMMSARGFPDRYDPFTKPPYIEALKDLGGHGRVMGGHGVLFPNYASSVGIEDLRYVNSLSPALFHEFRERYLKPEHVYYHSLWFTGSGYRGESGIEESIIRNLKYYSFLGVKYIILPSEIDLNGAAEAIYPDWDVRPFFQTWYYDGDVSIYENSYAMPRAFIVDRVRYSASYKEAQAGISADDFDISNEVVLEKPLPAEIEGGDQGAGKAEIIEYGANRAVIKADAEKNGILVLTDIFYPGWKAYIDGEQAEVYRVNGLVRGVFLNKGVHTVEFRYFPVSFLAGLSISAVSISLMGLCFVLGKPRGS